MGRRRGRHVATRARQPRWIPVVGVIAASLVVGGAIAGPSLFASAGQTPDPNASPTAASFDKGWAEAPVRQPAPSVTAAAPEQPASGGSSAFVPLPCPDGSASVDDAGAAVPCETPSGYPGG